MKRNVIIFGIIMLIPLTTSWAQTPIKSIDSLVVDLWPDYDRASVLVLITGSLPANTPLPATVTLPFPESARLNAIARIDSTDGKMKDDIISSPAPGEISFITPNLRFRLEYYIPYTANNFRRSFNFSWMADLTIYNFGLNLQQPLSAKSLETEPDAVNIVKEQDGFIYHKYPSRTINPGQLNSLQVSYTMTSAQLSAQSLRPKKSGEQTPELPVGSLTGTGTDWAMLTFVIGILLIIAAVIWQIVSRRSSAISHEPIETPNEEISDSKFCQYCGKQVDVGDKYCRKCGDRL